MVDENAESAIRRGVVASPAGSVHDLDAHFACVRQDLLSEDLRILATLVWPLCPEVNHDHESESVGVRKGFREPLGVAGVAEVHL